ARHSIPYQAARFQPRVPCGHEPVRAAGNDQTDPECRHRVEPVPRSQPGGAGQESRGVDAGCQAALTAFRLFRGKTGGAAMNERSATALNIGPEQVVAPGDALTSAANDASAPKRVVISLRNVRKSYTSASGEKVDVLRGVNPEVQAGSFNVIRGESGSGKTSLLRILGMLDTDFEGDYLFAEDSLKAKPDWYRDELRANNIGFVFQEGQLFGHMRIRE